MAFLKGTGQKYQVIMNEAQDMVFAIINSKTDQNVEEKLRKLIEMAVEESLNYETMNQVNDFARKKQVQIVIETPRTKTEEKSVFKQTQLRLDLAKQLKDMRNVVTFLEQNTIESNANIYEGMTLKETAEQVYDELLTISKQTTSLSDSVLQPVPLKIKEKIGTLMNSKEMNPALFFSNNFKMGVYLPILSPFIIPIILTITLVLRHKLYLKFIKKEEEDKVVHEKQE